MRTAVKRRSTRPTRVGFSLRFGLTAIAITSSLAGCSSPADRSTDSTYPTGSLTAQYRTTLDLSTACAFLAQRHLLKRAGDLLTPPVDGHELTDVILYLRDIIGVGSPKIQLAVQNIVDGLTSIKNGRPNVAAVLPDARLIAGECQGKRLAVPETH